MPLPIRLVVVEDEVDSMRSLRDAYDRASESAHATGLVLPRMAVWGPAGTLDRIRGEGRAGQEPIQWSDEELWVIDCWNRDGADDGARFRSTFFALDILEALRERKEAGDDVPQVIAQSRGMANAMVRAALSEFMFEREQVELVDAPGIKWGWRLRPGSQGERGAVLGAMYDRTTFEQNMLAILQGDRSLSLPPPPPGDAVWSEFLPTSCLASFHRDLRDDYPEAWRDHVLTREPVRQLTDRERTGIRRAGLRFLEPNSARGKPSYKGYVEIARRLAVPG